MTANAALRATGLEKRFGGVVATHDVSLSLARGERHALIGPNGAGKTTLINMLTGMLTPSAGRIELEGEDITHMPAWRRVKRGLVRTFQINQLFPGLTAREAMAVVIAEREGHGAAWRHALGRMSAVQEEASALLATFHLADVQDERSERLPYGRRRLLEIALAVACRPRVLLLDEPMAGVPSGQSAEILDTLAALPEDVTVLLIEHDMDLVFRFARRMSVLVNGSLLVQGTPQQIRADPQVRAVYLGEAALV